MNKLLSILLLLLTLQTKIYGDEFDLKFVLVYFDEGPVIPATSPFGAAAWKPLQFFDKEDHIGQITKISKWIRKVLNSEFHGLICDFHEMPSLPIQMSKHNHSHNPSSDSVPFNWNTRVILNSPFLTCDFYHANYVGDATNPKRFICAQGPAQESSVYPFWAMVIQEKVDIIVMVGTCYFGDDEKCRQYFPTILDQTIEVRSPLPHSSSASSKESYEYIYVTLWSHNNISHSTELSVRTINIEWGNGKKRRSIHHYCYENWVENCIPDLTYVVCTIVKEIWRGVVDELDDERPILVHSTNGIGRAGTLIAISNLMHALPTGKADVMQIVRKVREQRHQAIVTSGQYLHIHHALLEWHLHEKKKVKLGFGGMKKWRKWKELNTKHEKEDWERVANELENNVENNNAPEGEKLLK